MSQADGILNLVGKSIFRRWTRSYKQALYDSRILTVRRIVEALPGDTKAVLCSASGTGYYGNREDDLLTEMEPPGKDFLAGLAVDWEAEAVRGREKGARVVVLRFGIVLDKSGGAMTKMIPAFRLMVGGPLGSGKQWFPWIHLTDLLGIFTFVLEHPHLEGPINACAPYPVRNADLASALGRAVHRPAFMPAPGFMVRMALGEFGNVLLEGQRAIPQKLKEAGFRFEFERIEAALEEIVS